MCRSPVAGLHSTPSFRHPESRCVKSADRWTRPSTAPGFLASAQRRPARCVSAHAPLTPSAPAPFSPLPRCSARVCRPLIFPVPLPCRSSEMWMAETAHRSSRLHSAAEPKLDGAPLPQSRRNLRHRRHRPRLRPGSDSRWHSHRPPACCPRLAAPAPFPHRSKVQKPPTQ
jgi:hypothetical protein